MDFLQLGGIVASLLAGGVTKIISKKKGSTLHTILSPAMAVLAGAGATAATGQASDFGSILMGGLGIGGAAITTQSFVRGGRDLWRTARPK